MGYYRDWDKDSGVEAYEIGSGYIIVRFKQGRNRNYKYTTSSAGENNIWRMHQLAQQGDGLNEFIVENHIQYESKW